MIYDCIIIGAGASGLYCASQFSKETKGLILEHTNKAGIKLLMSGKGQCNVTNDENIKDFIYRYGKNGKKIRSLLYKYSNKHLYQFYQSHSINLTIRDDKKVFPSSFKASTIRDFLLSKAFPIVYQIEIQSIKAENDLFIIYTNKENYQTRNLILAVGGLSYPKTGSNGCLYELLRSDLNIQFTPLSPALTPIKIQDYPFSHLSGLSLKNIDLSIYQKDKKIHQASGDLLFTHKDLSGPVIINQSRYMKPGQEIHFNYIHETYESALSKLNQSLKDHHYHLSKHVIKLWNLPERFVSSIVGNENVSLKKLIHRLIDDTYIIDNLGHYHQAMVTSGGIDLSQMNMKTMEFKQIPHLYAIGECLDIDGDTGGYNLQFAYASACACAQSIKTKA